MKRHVVLAVLTFVILVLVQPSFSQSVEDIKVLKKDINALKENQTANHKDLQEIKKLVQVKHAPSEFKEAIINIQGAPFKGDKNAKIALIEFSDYQ